MPDHPIVAHRERFVGNEIDRYNETQQFGASKYPAQFVSDARFDGVKSARTVFVFATRDARCGFDGHFACFGCEVHPKHATVSNGMSSTNENAPLARGVLLT